MITRYRCRQQRLETVGYDCLPIMAALRGASSLELVLNANGEKQFHGLCKLWNSTLQFR